MAQVILAVLFSSFVGNGELENMHHQGLWLIISRWTFSSMCATEKITYIRKQETGSQNH